ncbi:MAG: DUF4363 family protein [Clostridia bacterium]|nr:DUF4363 family protein [Clostridia bacterium]
MKVLRLSIVVLICICIFIGVHSFRMSKMEKSISELGDNIKGLAINDSWDEVLRITYEIQDEWNKYKNWAALTINSESIEKLEISLEQAQTFAQIHKKSDFLGEFSAFSQLVEQIAHKEGLYWEEIF